MGRIFMGYWDCNYCDTTDIGGDKMECPNCGKARGKDVVFHLNPTGGKQSRRYVSEDSDEYRRAKSGPDWICKHCDSSNPATVHVCRNCGHPKDEDDENYYEHHPERDAVIPSTPTVTSEESHRESQYSKESPTDVSREDDKDEEDHCRSHEKTYTPSTPSDHPSFHFDISDLPWSKIGIGLLIITAIIGLIMLFIPKERYITVTGVDWQRSIVVEECRTIRESDWSVPPGGRTVYTQRKIHHYDRVIDHYDKVRHERTVVVGSHEEVVGYRDLGNGYFEEQTQTVYDHDTEVYYTYEPVYRDDPVPVYRTKYYYDIERWVYDHTVKASANDKEPYWPEIKLADNQRANGRSESYGITALYKDKESHYTMSYKDWSDIFIGSELHVKVHIGGRIELIYE